MNIYLAYYGSTLLQIIFSIKSYDYLYCCHYYLVIFVFFHILLHNRDGILPSPFCQSDLHSVLLSHHFSAPKLAILLLSGLWVVQLVRILGFHFLKLSDFSFDVFRLILVDGLFTCSWTWDFFCTWQFVAGPQTFKNVTSVMSMPIIYSIIYSTMMVWLQIKYLSTKAFKLGQSFRHSGAIILCWRKEWWAKSFSRWQGIDSRGEKQKKKTWSRSSYMWKSGKASEDPANHCLGG